MVINIFSFVFILVVIGFFSPQNKRDTGIHALETGVLSDTHIITTVHGQQLSAQLLSGVLDDMPDVLVFGHSHQPECRWVGSTLLFHPAARQTRV